MVWNIIFIIIVIWNIILQMNPAKHENLYMKFEFWVDENIC